MAHENGETEGSAGSGSKKRGPGRPKLYQDKMERQNFTLTKMDMFYLMHIMGKVGVYRQQFLPSYGDTEAISASWIIRAMLRATYDSVSEWDVKQGKTHELLARLVYQGYRDVRAVAKIQKMLDDAVGVGLDPHADEEKRKEANRILEMMMTGVSALQSLGVKLTLPPPPENFSGTPITEEEKK